MLIAAHAVGLGATSVINNYEELDRVHWIWSKTWV
jgi:hypothetical protein